MDERVELRILFALSRLDVQLTILNPMLSSRMRMTICKSKRKKLIDLNSFSCLNRGNLKKNDLSVFHTFSSHKLFYRPPAAVPFDYNKLHFFLCSCAAQFDQLKKRK